jgi:site-specific recombinase XerD
MSGILNNLPLVLDDYQIEDLLEQANMECFTGYRNYCILRLMVFNGLTSTEVARLRWEDVKLYEGDCYIRDNDDPRDSRRILLDFETLEHLRDLKRIQAIEVQPHSHIFTTKKNKPVLAVYIAHMVKRYARRAYLPEEVNPSTLRQTFGKNLYKKTRDIEEVREHMGYTKKTTLSKFKYLADEDIVTNY